MSKCGKRKLTVNSTAVQHIIWGVVVFLSVCFLCCCKDKSDTLVESNARSETKLLKEIVDNQIRPLIEEGKCVGVSVGVINGDANAVFSYGKVHLDSNEVPDGNTIYEIGSITKVFTTLLLADAVANGYADFNDTIDKFLPADVNIPDFNGRGIRLIDLATHTSALPRIPNNINILAGLNNPYSDYSEKELYEFLSSYKLQREPGAQYEYSNLGGGLLGHILELSEGEKYEQLLVSNICEPLGMDDTRITLSEQQKKRLAKGYGRNPLWPADITIKVPMGNWDFLVLAGCGALRSSVNDMMKFLKANMGIEKTHLYESMEITHRQMEKIEGAMRIALGWLIMDLEDSDEDIVWHNGGTAGYHSFIGFNSKYRAGVVVLSNTAAFEVDSAGFEILSEIIEKSRDKTQTNKKD